MERSYPNKDINIDLFIEVDNKAKEWHTGQCYEDVPAKQIKCRKCGGNKFFVAQGEYWTGIKCPNCNYEIEIHEG